MLIVIVISLSCICYKVLVTDRHLSYAIADEQKNSYFLFRHIFR